MAAAKKGRHVHAPHLARSAPAAVARDRRGHRARNVQTDHDRPRQLRDVAAGDFGRLVQSSLDLLRNLVADVHVRGQELVRELPRTADLVRVGQPRCHVIDHLPVGIRADDAMAHQRVEVHPQCLRTHLPGNGCPNRRTLGRVGQQVPAGVHVAQDQDLGLGQLGLAEGSQGHDLLRQVSLGGRSRLLDRLVGQPAEQGTPGVRRTSHLSVHLSRSGSGGARIRVCGFSGRRRPTFGRCPSLSYRPKRKKPDVVVTPGFWYSSGAIMA